MHLPLLPHCICILVFQMDGVNVPHAILLLHLQGIWILVLLVDGVLMVKLLVLLDHLVCCGLYLIEITLTPLFEFYETVFLIFLADIQGVSKKMPDSEIRGFRAHKSLLCLFILYGSFVLDTKVCLGTTGNVCVSLQCTL